MLIWCRNTDCVELELHRMLYEKYMWPVAMLILRVRKRKLKNLLKNSLAGPFDEFGVCS